jgi:uncharacterized protein (DUF1330 family)
MSAYIIVSYEIDNAEQLVEYREKAGPALRIGSDCEVLAVDSDATQIEGTGAGKQAVILKFDSVEQAKEIYESGEYSALLKMRLDATSKHFALLVDGLD